MIECLELSDKGEVDVFVLNSFVQTLLAHVWILKLSNLHRLLALFETILDIFLFSDFECSYTRRNSPH